MNNGRPKAIICDVNNENVDIMIKAVRQAKATITFTMMREKASKKVL